MQDILVQIVFGWPFIIVALLLAVAGVQMKSHFFIILGALIFLLPAWYLSHYPGLGRLAILLPLFIFGAAYYVKRDRSGLAWMLLAAPIVATGWLAYQVITQ